MSAEGQDRNEPKTPEPRCGILARALPSAFRSSSQPLGHEKDLQRQTLAVALGYGTGWLALGCLNAALLFWLLPRHETSIGVRAIHQWVGFGRYCAASLTTFAVVLAWRCWVLPAVGQGRRGVALTLTSLAGVSLIAASTLASEDLVGMAQRQADALNVPASAVHIALTVALALTIPILVSVSQWLRWPPLRAVCVVAAVAMHWLNGTISPRDNFGLHFYLSWLAATLLGIALVWPAQWASRVLERARVVWLAMGMLCVPALFGVALPLTNSQRVDWSGWSAHLLADRVPHHGAARTSGRRQDSENPFFAPRATLPPIPARPHGLAESEPVVIVLSIDAVRADVLEKKNEEFFPNIYELMREGTSFQNARSPGSATVYTLSSLSTGLYFSGRYWSKTKGDYWPFEDEALHFPALLATAGVATLHARSTSWLENERRIMDGFQRVTFPKKDWKWAKGKDLTSSLLEILKDAKDGPVFAFAHFLDSHDPYWPGKKKGKNAFNRYLWALRYVDEQVGRLVDALDDLGIRDRAILIITADHGEAFGEHGTRGHATTLYEEQIRVPLIFWGKNIDKQRRDEMVSLVDLGPTVLELFGRDTPAAFMGQSLVPALEGKPLALQRPIVAEARTLQSMVFEDGIKVIRDRRQETVEVYDLTKDPKEAHNLSDQDDPKFAERVQQLIDFFEVHTLKRPGYEPPLRK